MTIREKATEFMADAREVASRMLRHLGFMPVVLIVCGLIESHREDTRGLAVTTFVLAVYALGRVAYDRTLREMQEESDRRVAQDVARRIHGDNASSEEFEAWYRAVRIVDLSRVGKVTR